MAVKLHAFFVVPKADECIIAANSYQHELASNAWHPWYATVRDLMLAGF